MYKCQLKTYFKRSSKIRSNYQNRAFNRVSMTGCDGQQLMRINRLGILKTLLHNILISQSMNAIRKYKNVSKTNRNHPLTGQCLTLYNDVACFMSFSTL